MNVPRTVWKGRKILVLSGAEDQLVHYQHGGSEEFVERVLKSDEGVGSEGKVQVWVQEGW